MERADRNHVTENPTPYGHLGGGVLGGLSFEVISTKKPSLEEKISKAFHNVKNSQIQSSYTENPNILDKLGSDEKVSFILLNSNKPPEINVLSPDKFLISGALDSDTFINRLPYIFYNLTERARQEKLNLVTAHAAAVSKNGKGILILGDKGSGKTSLLLALCLDQNYQMHGNDLVILGGKDNLSIVSGSQQINIRLPIAIKLGLPIEDFTLNNQQVAYETKIPILPENIGIKPKRDPSPLSAVIRINLHSDNPEFMVRDVPSRETEALRLNENFSRYIRGITTPVELSETGIGGYFPDLDNPTLTNFRNSLVNTIINHIPFFYVIGSEPIATCRRLSEKLDQI